MSALKKLQSMISDTQDEKLVETLEDMVEIRKEIFILKKEMEIREQSLTDGDRFKYWLDVSDLSEEENAKLEENLISKRRIWGHNSTKHDEPEEEIEE